MLGRTVFPTVISLEYSSLLNLYAILTYLPLDKMAGIVALENFKYIFLNGNHRVSIGMSVKFVLWSPIDKNPALVQVMAWLRTDDKPLHELMLSKFTDAYMRHLVES